MLNPFEPAKPWTEEKHRQWAQDREKGKLWYAWRGMIVGFRRPPALVILSALVCFWLFVIWTVISGNASGRELPALLDTGRMLLLFSASFLVIIVIMTTGTALEKWEEYEKLYDFHHEPPSMTLAVVGLDERNLFAYTSTPDFDDKDIIQVLDFADGMWSPLHTTYRSSIGLDLALLPGSQLALSRGDYSLLLLSPNGVKEIETPGTRGFIVPLNNETLLLVGYADVAKVSVRMKPSTGEVEPLDLLALEPPAYHNHRAYLFDHGRHRLALVGVDSVEFIPHNPNWRPRVLSVAHDGTIYAAISSRSGGNTTIWSYDGVWKELVNIPFSEVFDLTYDNGRLLALTDKGFYQLEQGGKIWIEELNSEDARLGEEYRSVIYWRFQPLMRDVVAMNAVTGKLLIRRDGLWQTLPSVPAFTPHTRPVDLRSRLGRLTNTPEAF